MGSGSENASVVDFARELTAYLAAHLSPTGEEISEASQSMLTARPDEPLGQRLSTGRISEVLNGKYTNPPSAPVVFSLVRAVRHLAYPDAEPIDRGHADVVELLDLRTKAIERKSLGTFRERRLRKALTTIAEVHHGCFALYALNGVTLHIGGSTSEPLASRIEAVLDPANRDGIDREEVAEIEIWPMPELGAGPDAGQSAEAAITRVLDSLMFNLLRQTLPATLHPQRPTSDTPDLPPSRLYTLVDAGTLLAVRSALRDQAAALAEHASKTHARTESHFQRVT